MSAPDTDIKTEKKRHKPALIGIAVALGFAAVALVVFLVLTVARGNPPQGADVQIDGRTGAPVATE
ncbi:MAG: hypothetical protein GW905_08060 [Rhodobacterales bacterium]|nr:hypothetical protein [Rhodobacterales bacterium]